MWRWVVYKISVLLLIFDRLIHLDCLLWLSVFPTNLNRRTQMFSKNGSRPYWGRKDGKLIELWVPLHLIFTVISRIVPNYELPPALEKVEILRVVIRENITEAVWTFSFLSFFELTFLYIVDRPTYRRHCGFITYISPRILFLPTTTLLHLRSSLRSSWQSLDLLHTDWLYWVPFNLEGLNTSTRVVISRRVKVAATAAPFLVHVSRCIYYCVLINNATTMTKSITFHFQPPMSTHASL